MSQLKRIPQKTKKTCPKFHTVFELFCRQTSVLFVMCKCTVSSFVLVGSLILRHKIGSVRIWGCSSCDFDIGPCCEQKFQDRKSQSSFVLELANLEPGTQVAVTLPKIMVHDVFHDPFFCFRKHDLDSDSDIRMAGGSWIYAELADFLVPTGIPRRGGGNLGDGPMSSGLVDEDLVMKNPENRKFTISRLLRKHFFLSTWESLNRPWHPVPHGSFGGSATPGTHRSAWRKLRPPRCDRLLHGG